MREGVDYDEVWEGGREDKDKNQRKGRDEEWDSWKDEADEGTGRKDARGGIDFSSRKMFMFREAERSRRKVPEIMRGLQGLRERKDEARKRLEGRMEAEGRTGYER